MRTRVGLSAAVLLLVLLIRAASGIAGVTHTRHVQIALSKDHPETSIFAPLEDVVLTVTPPDWRGRILVRDGHGRVYVDVADGRSGARFEVRGALGTHTLEIFDGKTSAATEKLIVDVGTSLTTSSGKLDSFARRLAVQIVGTARTATVDGKGVHYFLPQLRGESEVTRAARYLDANLTGFPALFIKYQKENGLVFGAFAADDHFDPYTGTFPGVQFERDTFGAAYTGRSEDGRTVFHRSPVEADTESLLVEQVFSVWQATGDDAWAARALPHLESGLGYLMHDPLRWSTELGLVKRGFTIDMWNLQHPSVAKLHPNANKNVAGWTDFEWIDANTPMGIMHGDNSALYGAAAMLARLFAHLGQPGKAAEWTETAARIRTQLEKISWNGIFYRHFVRLTPAPEWLDLGANEPRQLSLSNTLAISRGVTTHAQSVSIIREYMRRRERLHDESPAEWFTIDPPFHDGFGYMAEGEFVNGTVTPFVAGELARAAFQHGLEAYGADILARLLTFERRGGGLAALYHRSKRPTDWVEEDFLPVDLRAVANRHLRGDRENGLIGHPDNDLREFPVGRHAFLGKPFDVIDPDSNGGRAAVVLWGSGSPGPRETVVAGIRKKARSIYFLHAMGNDFERVRAGEYEITYEDGTRVRIPLLRGRNIGRWWADEDAGAWHIAWRGKNPHVSRVAMGVWGWDNIHPEKRIDSITLRAADEARLQILGITLSSAPVEYERDLAMRGFPDAWAAAPVFVSLFEGVAGVTDEHKVFEHAAIAPRWLAMQERSADVAVRYPASDGYVAYHWEQVPADHRIILKYTGSGQHFDFHVQLPPGSKGRTVSMAGRGVRFETTTIEQTPYVDFSLDGPFNEPIDIRY